MPLLDPARAPGAHAVCLAFTAPGCRLCRRLRGPLADLRSREADWLEVVEADVSCPGWLPEVVHYDVRDVPCFILLRGAGAPAAARSPPPRSLALCLRAVEALGQCRPPPPSGAAR